MLEAILTYQSIVGKCVGVGESVGFHKRLLCFLGGYVLSLGEVQRALATRRLPRGGRRGSRGHTVVSSAAKRDGSVTAWGLAVLPGQLGLWVLI